MAARTVWCARRLSAEKPSLGGSEGWVLSIKETAGRERNGQVLPVSFTDVNEIYRSAALAEQMINGHKHL